MANSRGFAIFACAVRFSRLDADGTQPSGATNAYVLQTSDLLEASYTPVYDDGAEVTESSACGDLAIDVTGDRLQRDGEFEIEFLPFSPELFELFGGATLLDNTGDSDGWAMPLGSAAPPPGVFVELWSKRYVNNQLPATKQYIRSVLPRVYDVRFGERTFQNGRMGFPFSAKAAENVNAGTGPFADIPAFVGAASQRQFLQFVESTIPVGSDTYVTVPA